MTCKKFLTKEEVINYLANTVILDEQYGTTTPEKLQPRSWDEPGDFGVWNGRDYLEFDGDLREFMHHEWPVREPKNHWDTWRPMTGTAKFIGTRIFGKKALDAAIKKARRAQAEKNLQGRKNMVIGQYERMLKAITEFQAVCEQHADLIEGTEITITISVPSFCQEK